MDKTMTILLGVIFMLALVVFGGIIGGWFAWVLYGLAALMAGGLVVILVRYLKKR